MFVLRTPSNGFLLLIIPVVIEQSVLESSDDIWVVEVHVLDTPCEVLEYDQTLVDMGHSSDVEVAVQVQPLEVALDSVSYAHTVDWQDQVPGVR